MATVIESFLLSRRVANCTSQTLHSYEDVLLRFVRESGITTLETCTPLVVQTALSKLAATMKPVTQHKHFRTLKVFFSWCLRTGLLQAQPMAAITMKAPRVLPRVPDDDTIRKLLAACPDTFEGRRNRALVALLADSGLRISEALRLRLEDINFSTRTITVRQGKGSKDGIGFFGAETAAHIRTWLQARRDAYQEDYVFVAQDGRSITANRAAHILYALSRRAGLTRKFGPHSLRHYAATSILKQTGDLELVRQVLRHESLAMALRYAHLTKPDVSRKFRRASPLDNLRAGR